jgi:4-amino-4-deoxy-L-arabinose transferase-like glycosyltransferase
MTASASPAEPVALRRAGPADAPGARRAVPGWLAEWWPLLVLAVVAFAVRWPNLWYIPQFTDEVFDAQVSYGIWEGKRPLIGVNAYTGAFHYYVQAGLFWLFGPSIYLPRLLVLVLGVGAVLATGLLGLELGRRAAPGGNARAVRTAGWIGALVGGGLLATSVVHVLTNSHLAWPHCTLLLYLTLSLWCVEGAVDRSSLVPVGRNDLRPYRRGEGETGGGVPHVPPWTKSPKSPKVPLSGAESGLGGEVTGGWWLVWAGLLFGLAQQQHPTMLLLWPVFLGYVGWRGRAYFRTRWAYAAMLAFLVGISPLIFYNLVATDFGSLKESQEQTSGYQEGRDKDFSYRGRAVEIAQTLPRIVASTVEFRPDDSQPIPPATPFGIVRMAAYSALAIAGLVAAARLGAWSLPLAVATFLLLLPLFPASHDNLPRQGRYLMPLVPLMFAGVGGLAALLWCRVANLGAGSRLALAGVVALVVLAPLVTLVRYEQEVLAANQTNDRYFVTLGALERQRRPDEAVVLDPTLKNDRTGAAGTAQRTFDFMMELRGVQRVFLEESSERIGRQVEGETALVLADLQPSSLRNRANADAWTLEPLPNDEGGGFTLWRISRR